MTIADTRQYIKKNKSKLYRMYLDPENLKYFKVICQLKQVSMSREFDDMLAEYVTKNSVQIPGAIKSLLLREKS